MAGNARGKWARRRAVLIGAVVLLTFAGSLWIALTASQGLPGAPVTEVKAAFTDVGALRVGDDVRIANIRVGRVEDIELVDGKPVVTLHFDGDRAIYRNASAVTASVSARSALGQKYVDFSVGDPSAGRLPPGEVVPPAKTESAHELSDVLAVLDDPTRQALGSTIREAGTGAGGHAQDFRQAAGALPTMLPDLGAVSRALAVDSGADLTKLLRATDDLATSFAGRQQELGQLLGQLSTTLGAVAVDDGKPLAAALGKAPDTLTQVRGALQALQGPLASTQQAMRALEPGANALGAATPDLRGVLREGVSPLNKLPGVADQAQPAVDALGRTLTDARPLAPKLSEALSRGKDPLGVLAPYSSEVSLFFSYLTDALSGGDPNAHYLRIYPIITPETFDGILPVQDPLLSRNVYPAPGESLKDKKTSPFGSQKGAGR